MEKIITIDENTELKLSNNASWFMEYQEQFGHDIVPDIMPLVGAILELVEGMTENGMTVKDAKDIVNGIKGGAASNALVELSGLRMTDFINIVWALAKTADETIDPPKQWIRQFDVFPMDLLVPEVFSLVASGAMTSKNWTRLQSGARSL